MTPPHTPTVIQSTCYDHPLHKEIFHPTVGSAHVHSDEKKSDGHTSSLHYNSRKARKGRYALKTHRIQHRSAKHEAEKVITIRAKTGESKFKPHLTLDVSFWIAFLFTLGSAVWVANGFTILLPLYMTSISDSEGLTEVYFRTAAALAFVGGTIFEVGSYLMVVEALNRGQETGFGTAVISLFQTGHKAPQGYASVDSHDSEKGFKGDQPDKAKKFIWWGKPLWRDLGYDAAIIQLFAATVFWISTLTGLPGVIPGFPDDPSLPIVNVFFWTPQVIGGTGFIISSLLLTIEVQKKWYIPNLKDVGWHIGFWNLVGSVGFTLCGAMGYNTSDYWVDNSGISTFWGSWGFLIGSTMQLYEALWREPEQRIIT